MSALLGIAGSLISGIFGRNSQKKADAQNRKWALEDQAMQWVRHRKASEDGGFNPLATLGLGQGVAPTPVSSNNYMGEAIAQSALILGDKLARTEAASQGRTVEDLRRQRDILVRKLTQQTIRPTVPGIYGNGGSNGVVAGRPSGVAGAGGLNGNSADRYRPLPSVDPIDPRREVDNKPVPTSSGVMVVDNPYTGRIYVPTLDGDEPLDMLDAPALIYGPPQIAGNYGYTMTLGGGRESRPGMSREESLRIREAQRRKAREAMEWRKPRLRFNPNHRDGYFYP